MEMQQILEILAMLNAKMDADQAKAKANHKEMMAKIDAETKAIQEKAKAMRDKRMEANRKRDREDLKAMMDDMDSRVDAIQAKAGGKQEESWPDCKDIKPSQAEMRSILRTFRSELKETIQRQMRATIQSIWSELDETTTC
jgi:hypothetical protein